jgi:hypothetical protein
MLATHKSIRRLDTCLTDLHQDFPLYTRFWIQVGFPASGPDHTFPLLLEHRGTGLVRWYIVKGGFKMFSVGLSDSLAVMTTEYSVTLLDVMSINGGRDKTKPEFTINLVS